MDNENIVDWVSKHLELSNSDINGLASLDSLCYKPPIILRSLSNQHKRFCQILLIDKHFICITSNNISSLHFDVHDSYNNPLIMESPSLVSIMSAFTRSISGGKLTFNMFKSSQQPDCYNCGCYAIANAVTFCSGKSPSNIFLDSSSLRTHLNDCLNENKLTSFPTVEGERRQQRISSAVTREKVYCICRQGFGKKEMIECERCFEWFHLDCINITDKVIEQTGKWFCNDCLKRCQRKTSD